MAFDAEDELGPLVRRFGPNWVVVVLLCGVWLAVVDLTGWVASRRQTDAAVATCLGVAVAGLPIVAWLATRRIGLHERGLESRSWLRRQRVAFEDADSLRSEEVRVQWLITVRDVTLGDLRGVKIRITNALVFGVRELVDELRARTRAPIVRNLVGALARGETVDFGYSLAVRQGELLVRPLLRQRAIPLVEVRELSLRPSSVAGALVLVVRLADGVEEHTFSGATNAHVALDVLEAARRRV